MIVPEVPLSVSRVSTAFAVPLRDQLTVHIRPELVPWTPLADQFRKTIEATIDQPLNHALIQHYRGGKDYISEHADKSLDIRRGTKIVNLSLGATRVMILRTKLKKEGRIVQRVTLPHNSLFVLGWESNRTWTHEIRQDKRMDSLKRDDEMRNNCERISLTFRDIATFMRPSDGQLYGQGACCKTREALEDKPAERTAEENSEEALTMLKAFSAENRDPDFDWDAAYGTGFHTLNFRLFNQQKVAEAVSSEQ